LGLDAGLIELYRKRQPTISEHQQTIAGYLRLRPFDDAEVTQLEQFLFEEACRLEQAGALMGQASAHFEGTEHQAAIAEALNEPLLNQAESPDFDLVTEGHDLIERMLAEKRAQRSAELMPLVAGGTATPEQKAEYEGLIARLSLSKQGNAGPEERSKV